MGKSMKVRDRRDYYRVQTDWTKTAQITCRKKGAYESARAAQLTANDQMAHYEPEKVIRVYKCLECKKFHLTSTVLRN